jgi:hypothetical protein
MTRALTAFLLLAMFLFVAADVVEAKRGREGRSDHPMSPSAPREIQRQAGLFDNHAIKQLPGAEKAVAIPFVRADGTPSDPDTLVVWPFRCGTGA